MRASFGGRGSRLLALCALGAAGCLADPPTFAPRGQIPPFILAGQVDPPLQAIYEGPPRFQVNVPFRSEDVNIDLQARLFIDLPAGSTGQLADLETGISAGNYEELRTVTMDWIRPISGCHSLTLILTYVGNFDVTGLPRDDTLAARVVWWLNIGDIDGEVRMATCPGASQEDAVPSGP